MNPPENQGTGRIRKIVWVLVCSLIVLPFSSAIFPSGRTLAASEAELVQEGIDLYNQKKMDQARQALESAEIIYPDNIAVPYYLGLIYLEQKQRAAAISHWKRYVEQAPQDENTLAIRKSITLLLRKEAEEYAKKAVAEEAGILNEPIDENAVAVAAFKNMGSEQLGPLGKGMAAMIIADLSVFKSLKVVEREKLQALLEEMKLGTSGLVEKESAPKVGKLLRAKYVSSGSLTDPEKESLQMASILLDAGLDTTVGTQGTQGNLKKFYDLEKELACRIAADLGRDCKSAPKAFNRIHTKSLPALAAYSQGLDYADENKYDEARTMYKKALEEDPDFDLAQAALVATPFAAMLLLSESQIISNASAGAPSASASATASTAAASSAGGGLGIGTTAAVAGGTAVAVGAVAAVAAAMPKDDDNNSGSGGFSFAGRWSGTWSDDAGGGGDLVMNLTQNGGDLGGDITLSGSECLSSGTISGSFDDNQLQLNINSGSTTATLTANVDTGTSIMEGSLDITGGECTGRSLTFSTTQTGSADVVW